MASSFTKQQMKLSKSIISSSAYRATRTWFSLLFSLKPKQEHERSLKQEISFHAAYKNISVVLLDLIPAASTARRISYELMAPDLSISNSLKMPWKNENVTNSNTESLADKSTLFLPATFGFCSRGSETPPVLNGHCRLSGQQCVKDSNCTFTRSQHSDVSKMIRVGNIFGLCVINKEDTSIRLTIVLHVSVLKPSVFISLSKT